MTVASRAIICVKMKSSIQWPEPDSQQWLIFEYQNLTVKVYPLNGDWEWEIASTTDDKVLDSGADPSLDEAKKMVEIYLLKD